MPVIRHVRKWIAIIAGLLVWAGGVLVSFDVFGALSPPVLIVLAAAEIVAGAAVVFLTNVFFTAQLPAGIAHLVIALLHRADGTIPTPLIAAVLAFSLACASLLSFIPKIRSITAIAVRLRRFPPWFANTAAFRRLEVIYNLIWSVVFAGVGVLFLTPLHSYAGMLLAISGMACEVVCFLVLTLSGYRYLDFLTGKARHSAPPGGVQ